MHYAGSVTYDVSKFTRKNNDKIGRETSVMMYKGTHPLLKTLFPEGTRMRYFIRLAIGNALRNCQVKSELER